MDEPGTLRIEDAPRVVAPDGSDVRVLLRLPGGSMAHFELAPGRASMAVRHRTVSELWYILAGRGEMWRSADGADSIGALGPGVCITIPVGTAFQFRSLGPGALQVVAVTMPPWPGDDEAISADGCAAWSDA